MVSIGIDIGSFSIKVAKVRAAGKGYELLNIGEYPLTQDPNKDTQIDIIEALRDIEKKFGEDGAIYVAGAHPYEVSVRRKEFPFRERHKILKSLPFELEDDIPFSFENSIFDAKITHLVGPVSHLLACACPKEHVLQIIKKMGDGGIMPEIVSIDSLAQANLFEEWREAPFEYPAATTPIPGISSADLILNIGHRTTTLLAIRDGYLLDTRMIDWGGRDLAEAISARYSMHYLEALKELRKKAFILTNNEGATRDQVALSDVVKASVDQFAQKLLLAIMDLKSLYNVEFKQIVLTGGVSQLRNLGPYITTKIEVATNRLAKLDTLQHLDFAGSPNNELAMTTAIGLALEGIKRPKNPPLNLLKGEFEKQSQTLRLFWDKWGHAVQMMGLAFVSMLIWGMMRESFSLTNSEEANDQLRTQAKNIMGLKGAKVSPRNIRTYIREQEQKLKLKELVDNLQSMNSALDILNKISGAVPDKPPGPDGVRRGINITSFSVNGSTVTLDGEASSLTDLTNLQNALKNIALGGQVQSANPPNAKTPSYKSFSHSFKVERKPGGQP